jgi:hypothetical protein
MNVQIKLTSAQKNEIILNCLCNSSSFSSNIELDYSSLEYNESKQCLKNYAKRNEVICFEDVIMHMLKNGKNFVAKDVEESEEDVPFNLKSMHSNFSLIPFRFLSEMIQEQDDADTSDAILQYLILGDHIYG